MRSRVVAALAAAGILVVAACDRPAGQYTPGALLTSTASGAWPRSTGKTDWLVSLEALSLLSGAGMSQAELSANFDRPGAYVIAGTQRVDGYRNAVHTQTFTSLDELQSGIAHGLDSSVRAVLYDDEAWSLTPTTEQRGPTAAETRASTLAHAHNLRLIAAPAMDLTHILAPGESSFTAYLRLGISADAARAADVIDIQAQGNEANTAQYTDFVKKAAAAARAANPRVVVLAGISTNPGGQHVTVDQIRAAIDATRGSVDGYWLNVPQAGKACPRCGTAQTQVAVTLLRELARTP